MLHHLDIRDFAIVHHVSLELSKGLTVLSGETGAGKSILIDAIGLLLGDRADSGAVRAGCSQADLSAQWRVAQDSEAGSWLAEQALQDGDDPGGLLLRRVIRADGGSRAFVNGRPVAVAQLRELGEKLIEIHGQHAHQLLRKPDHQRRLLDDFGGFEAEHQAVANAAHALLEQRKRLQKVEAATTSDPQQVEFLRHQWQELDALGLTAEELQTLEDEHRRLSHAGELLQRGSGAVETLVDNDEALRSRLHNLAGELRELEGVAADIGEAAELVEQAAVSVEEAGASLRRVLDRVELDPQRLQQVDQRLANIHDLARKHRVRADALPDLCDEMASHLQKIDSAGGNLAEMRAEEQRLEIAYKKACAPLSQARARAARKLGEAVCQRLRELAMPDARLEVAVRTNVNRAPSAQGADDVEIQFTANPGQPLRPLLRVASGGELSRVSLALQVALSARANVPVMIFDEVDVGVGGATAEVVGRLLRELADRCQVLCVTHLPQVAAQAHRQINIRKRAASNSTQVEAETLDQTARREEIARMLGGVTITEETRQLAQQMLSSAES